MYMTVSYICVLYELEKVFCAKCLHELLGIYMYGNIYICMELDMYIFRAELNVQQKIESNIFNNSLR